METKVCNKCNTEKDVTEFEKWRKVCKTCKKEYQKDWKKNNKKLIKESQKKWYQNNKEVRNKQSKEYYEKNKETINKQSKEYYEKNKETINKRHRDYKKNNRERLNKLNSEYNRVRRLSDPLFKLRLRIGNSIYNSLKKKGFTKNSRSFEILGCSYEEFKKHIESQWEDWMNWDNHGLYNGEEKCGWDLDHIIPLSSALCEEDIIRLNHHSNIQPLCSYVNRCVKRDNIDW